MCSTERMFVTCAMEVMSFELGLILWGTMSKRVEQVEFHGRSGYRIVKVRTKKASRFSITYLRVSMSRFAHPTKLLVKNIIHCQ